MPYNKTLWINNNEPPISADNLNKIEQGIYDNSIAVETQEGLLDGHTVRSDVPSNAVFTDTTYTAGQNVQINGTTISATDTVYDDTNITSRVSTVESLLDGHSVGKNVPADAVFTDTVYDDTALSERVSENEDDISDLEEKTIHLGAGTTYYDFAPQIELTEQLGINAENVKVKIEAVQSGSGTPSPQNVRPITGFDVCEISRVGKNKLPFFEEIKTNAGVTVTPNEDGTYKWSGTATSSNVVSYSLPPLNLSGYYKYKSTHNSVQLYYEEDGVTKAITNNTVFNIGEITPTALVFYTSNGTTRNEQSIKAWLVKNETDETFEPYRGRTYTINLGDTIYGGTLDVTSGKLVMVVDRASVDLGSLTWTRFSTGTTNKYRFQAPLTNVKPSGGNTGVADLMSSDYISVSPNDTYACVDGVAAHATNESILVYDEAHSSETADVFTTSISGVQLVYELATPVTIQLTPQQIQLLDGYNLIFANTGDIAITTNDIEGAIVQADALIEANTQAIREIDSFNTSIFGTIENGTTASKAYAKDDYFVKDKKMCKALTSIAQGATFTLNTNYAAYTLADILKAIENL